jgi:hypothetical protein
LLPYTKYRIKKYFWLAMIFASSAIGLRHRGEWLICASMFCGAVAASYEYGVVCENWRFKDVAEYLRKNGYL